MINNKHPQDVGLTYWKHLKFAWGECIRSFSIAIVMLIHGVIPWIWDWKYNAFIDGAKKRIAPLCENRKGRK